MSLRDTLISLSLLLGLVLVLCLVTCWLSGCALIKRPHLVNLRIQEEPFVLRAEGRAIEAWTYCVRAVVETFEVKNPKLAPIMTVSEVLSVKDTCGPYPGHAEIAQYTPDVKGSSMFSMPLLPIAPVLGGVLP